MVEVLGFSLNFSCFIIDKRLMNHLLIILIKRARKKVINGKNRFQVKSKNVNFKEE